MAAEVKRLQTKLFINNEFVDAVSGKTFEVVNPATGEKIADVAEGDAADIDKAVAAARAAFKSYRTTDGTFRRNLMLKLADLIEQHKEELAAIESLDNGKPYLMALNVDVASVVEVFKFYAGYADKIEGKIAPVPGQFISLVRREPVGVCGQIIPWNFPLLMAAWKLGPCLALGNCTVMKPAEQTPLSILRVAELIKEAGYPPGVVNIVPGFGPTAGGALTAHPNVNKIAFTGSTEVGSIIMRACSNSFKRVTLELGGKSALIVCADADLDQAVAIASGGIFFNQGQVCTASSRILIQEEIHDEFVAKMKANAAARKVGRGQDLDTDIGPLVSDEQHEKVLGYIAKGKAEGATCVYGGERVGESGYFVQPTIFTDVTDGMTIAREEIFGPVASVLKFKTIEEAIERANSTCYGLAAGVLTKDLSRALHVSSMLAAGTVWVNCWNVFSAAQPFGGFGASGIGRELGSEGLEAYTEKKSICINVGLPLVKN